jgi:hypothetical protein
LGDAEAMPPYPDLGRGKSFVGTLRLPISNSGIPLDFYFTAFGVPIVTQTLRPTFQSPIKEDVQFIPAHISGNPDFFVMNILTLMDCIDQERTEGQRWTTRDHRSDLAGEYRSVDRLVLETKRIDPDARVFRLKLAPPLVIIPESTKVSMELTGCKGAKFLPIDTV